MKKNLLILLMTVSSGLTFGQIGIGTLIPQGILHIDGARDNHPTNPPTVPQQINDFIFTSTGEVGIGTIKPRGVMDLNNNGINTKGLVLPTNANVNNMINPQGGTIAPGTMMYDSTLDCIRFFRTTGVWSPCLSEKGAIATISCGTATHNGTLTSFEATNAVSSSIPYTGGNGGVHDLQIVTSTGVTGLTATLAKASFDLGAGSVLYTITGIPSGSGTASFAINIGGKNCTLTRTVVKNVCVVKISPSDSKEFMCHNLGANQSLDPHVPAKGIHGNYYQWGIINDVATPDTPSGSISRWNTSYPSTNAWTDASKTAKDPCPSGFKVPTKAQWDGVVANNTLSTTGSFTDNETNFGAAVHFGPNASTKLLTIPASGVRQYQNGSLLWRGSRSYVWSSTQYNASNAYLFNYIPNSAGTVATSSQYAAPVRCISE